MLYVLKQLKFLFPIIQCTYQQPYNYTTITFHANTNLTSDLSVDRHHSTNVCW